MAQLAASALQLYWVAAHIKAPTNPHLLSCSQVQSQPALPVATTCSFRICAEQVGQACGWRYVQLYRLRKTGRHSTGDIT